MWARRTSSTGTPAPAGDGVDHHAVERTLAQLAAEHAPQQALLGRRRPGEHRRQQRRGAVPSNPAPTRAASSLSQRSISRTSSVGSSASAGVELAQRRPPDADASLAGLAGEQPDGDGRLVGRQRPQQAGEQRRLLAALGRRRDVLGDGGELDEPHLASIFTDASDRGASRDSWRRNGDVERRRTLLAGNAELIDLRSATSPATVCSRRGTATTLARRDD